MVTGGQERTSPGHMEMADAEGLTAYPVRMIPGAHPRSRPLQRHHTIQNSDDAYVRWGQESLVGQCPSPLLVL